MRHSPSRSADRECEIGGPGAMPGCTMDTTLFARSMRGASTCGRPGWYARFHFALEGCRGDFERGRCSISAPPRCRVGASTARSSRAAPRSETPTECAGISMAGHASMDEAGSAVGLTLRGDAADSTAPAGPIWRYVKRIERDTGDCDGGNCSTSAPPKFCNAVRNVFPSSSGVVMRAASTRGRCRFRSSRGPSRRLEWGREGARREGTLVL
jgi:hypothetical protein